MPPNTFICDIPHDDVSGRQRGLELIFGETPSQHLGGWDTVALEPGTRRTERVHPALKCTRAQGGSARDCTESTEPGRRLLGNSTDNTLRSLFCCHKKP